MEIQSEKQAEYEKYKAINLADDYSKNVVDFGEAWATLMEKEMAEGKTLAAVAQATSLEANREGAYGISGFQYGCAVSALTVFWKHGKALYDWQEQMNREQQENAGSNHN